MLLYVCAEFVGKEFFFLLSFADDAGFFFFLDKVDFDHEMAFALLFELPALSGALYCNNTTNATLAPTSI